jgi:hypothetical protein
VLFGVDARSLGQQRTILRLGFSSRVAQRCSFGAEHGRPEARLDGAGLQDGRRAAACWALLALCAPVPLGGCATDLPLAPPRSPQSVDPLVEILQLRARRGDRNAQLELGIRYEEGRGVDLNLDTAEHWYRRAARDVARPSQVYSPAVGPHGRARILRVRGGSSSRGLAEARQRLRQLRELRSGRRL